MSVAGTSSDLISLNSVEIESAWHTLSLQTSPGCPAQLPELELRSRLPHSLQEYISRIPGSPFTMTSGGFMNTSFVPCEGFAEFLTSPTASNVPRDAFSCRGIRGSRNSSVTYARKRKAQAPGNGTELLTSLKKRSMLIHKGGEVEPVKSIAVPKLLSSSNEIPSKETFDHSLSVNEQYLVNTGNVDESQRFYDFSAPLPDLNYFDIENMGCMRVVDTTACAPCVTNSVVPLRTDLHFPYDHAFLDIGLSAFQWSEVIEHDSKPVGMPNQPSLVNQTLEENSNTLSLELELFSGTPEVHTLERLKVIEKDFEASLMDLVNDNSQSDFQLASKKPPVTESIHWRKLHSKDDKLNTAQLESNETIFASRPTHCQWKETQTFNFAFADDAHNSAAIGLAMMSEANDLRSSKSSIPDNGIQNVPGPNFESIINAFTEEQYENVESSSEQKLLPYLLSIIMAEEEEEGSGLNQGGDGTVYKAQRKEDGNFLAVKHETEQTKSEGLPKLLSLSNEVTTMNSPERKLMPKFESFILQKMEGAGKEEHMNGTELSNISALSNQICRKANFDAPNPMGKEKDSLGMGSLDYSTVGLDHAYNLPRPLHDFTYSEFRNINYIREDKRESTTYATNSMVTHNKTVDFLHEDVSLDIGLNASIPNEHDALRRLTTAELDCRPLLDGVLDRPSATNLTLGEDCNAHSIELGLHVHERLSMIEKDLEQSLMEPVQDKSEACHAENNSQNVYPSPCQNQLVIEAIDEREVHSKDDKLSTSQLESKEITVASKLSQCHRNESSIMTIAFGDNIVNSTAIGEKQRTSNNPTVNDLLDSDGQQNLDGPNLTSNITSSMKDPDRNVEVGLIHLQKVKDICSINSTSPSKDQDREVVVGSIHLHKFNETCDENLPLKEKGEVLVTKPSKLSVFAMDEIADVSEEKQRAFKNPSINDQIADVSEEIQRALKNPSINDQIADVSEDKQRAFNNPSINDQIASVGQQTLVGSNFASNSTSSTKDLGRDIEVGLVYLQKQKDVCNANMASKEYRVNAVTKNLSEQKLMPDFESFIILEEEGSGGYGTVYKAQRKDDRKIFAVKCPHANAHSHHVNNELKMLERFGGRNFVIKYEGSFKNGESECFVLEHVEHDRPEILKKEISLFELQWYGFCMFRALASLHKQGVVHRDVKPGNFLFSRNVNKGYLIDFNLASDLHQKFCKNSKRKMPSASAYLNSLPEFKSSSSLHSRKFSNRGLLENSKKAPNESKKVPISKSSKKKTHKDHEDGLPIVDRSKHGSQTADVSGLTSTKDQTSNKTPVDWLNQPMPCKGRKELINFVHKAMHSTQNLKPVSNFPSSQRKRVAAPMSPNDTRPLMLTPMPLHSGGNVVSGAGLKSKVAGKVKREGPCVGTKGFRAPEVLFKSFHQGCKIDMWSAGVTMLYLIIGRAPFGGDPEQNIKEIAKLRGSEELWEVAKLHNCETSFPVDLLDVSSLKSMKLRDWCAKHTRRPEFFELIPESLFDLVDRCLTVNPRCRFSAEEALMHKFFAPCHESIRKQRMLRKVVASDPSTSNL